MKFHEIDVVGRLWVQRLPVLPEWTTDDVGRLIYVEETQSVYYGGKLDYADWIEISEHHIDEGTALDPITGTSFNDREYIMKINNGNIRLYY